MREKFLSDEELDKSRGDDSIYSDSVRDRLVEDDELSPEEAGFMKGYDDACV